MDEISLGLKFVRVVFDFLVPAGFFCGTAYDRVWMQANSDVLTAEKRYADGKGRADSWSRGRGGMMAGRGGRKRQVDGSGTRETVRWRGRDGRDTGQDEMCNKPSSVLSNMEVAWGTGRKPSFLATTLLS